MTAFEQRDYRHMTTRRPCPPPSPAAGLAAQHPKLLPQDQDLQVLGAVISTGEDQQTGQQADDQPSAARASTDYATPAHGANPSFRAPHLRRLTHEVRFVPLVCFEAAGRTCDETAIRRIPRWTAPPANHDRQ